ncbi:hypothetical protein DFQ27_006614 [Actinomortierella ambigua]|uniref:Uncharacterized protein n=1 Tax=Actinomortierella ambigua TaxID=1343610 RepID=A0A9P6U083_9FUNG|nr:hypothetical protein DFQ27_006614 [Actinomortierella ambigua]
MVGAITSYSGITRVRSHQALESLEIDGNLRRLEVGSLAPFLMSCSDKLQSVEGLEAKFWAHPKIGEALQMIGYASKVLRSDSLDPSISMTDLIKMIAQGSPWTRIQLDTSMMTKGVADAIVRHSAGNHLEAVEILHRGRSDSGPGMQGYHMQEILHRSPRLKTFLAHWLVDDVISDRDILSSEWATRSLEHIDLKIAVFRPFDCAPIHVHMHSYDIQRQVLRRIGQQKKLRKLVIGGMTIGYFKKRIYRQFECLEMNLESGLDELADLKELVELDISEMNHRVRVPDLEWMARNFPSLERLSMGMSDRPLPADVTEWLRRHRPGWASY